MKTPLDQKIKKFEKNFGHEPETDSRGDDSGKRVGYEFIAATLVFGGIGYLIDRSFDTMPIFTLVLFFLGFATGVYNAWRIMNGHGLTTGYKKPHKKPGKTRAKDTSEIN